MRASPSGGRVAGASSPSPRQVQHGQNPQKARSSAGRTPREDRAELGASRQQHRALNAARPFTRLSVATLESPVSTASETANETLDFIKRLELEIQQQVQTRQLADSTPATTLIRSTSPALQQPLSSSSSSSSSASPSAPQSVLVSSGRRPNRRSRAASAASVAAPAAAPLPPGPILGSLHSAAGLCITQEEEQTYCHILQEARKLHAHRDRLARRLGRAPSMQQLAAAAKVPDEHAAFVLRQAPRAHTQLLLSFKGYIAWQARRLVGEKHGHTYSESGWRGGGAVQMDDIFLSGVQGLMQAVYRFDVRAAGPGDSGSTGRLITYAAFYIKKFLIAAIRDGAYSQVFIPRFTLDLQHSVTSAAAELRGELGAEPSLRDIATRVGVSERAVGAVLAVQRTQVVGLAAEGADGSPYEDVQMVKQQDHICASGVLASSCGTTLQPEAPGTVGSSSSLSAGSGWAGRAGPETDAEGLAAREVAWQRADKLLRTLMTEREAMVLSRTMGLGREGDGISTYVLAEELGVSRQALDKARKKALEKLRKACAGSSEVARALEEVCVA